jgi:energy-coupling factor transporter ATP-binding protein EcfA2
MTKFSKLVIENWRQFTDINIDLHPRLTVITGANGAGKSTLIRIFSQHLGFQRPLFGVPYLGERGDLSYFSGIFSRRGKRILRRVSISEQASQRIVGRLIYTNGVIAELSIPNLSGAQFNIGINNQQQVLGAHIDSHQPISNYKAVDSIPIRPVTPQNAYEQYSAEINNAYSGGRSNFSPMYRLKEALISLAVFGEGNSEVDGNPNLSNFYEEFQRVLRAVLPDSLEFKSIKIQPPEVVLRTGSGDFVIDAVSGGILALIDFAWRIFSFAKLHDDFVVTIDEPENHLHPSLQRDLMPRLMAAFPTTQFIIATHSPFMVTAVKDSSVYALRYNGYEADDSDLNAGVVAGTNRVESIRLDSIRRAATVNEILREVLGVPATMPAWAHDELSGILNDFQNREISAESISALRDSLEERGFEELYPEALAKFIGSRS